MNTQHQTPYKVTYGLFQKNEIYHNGEVVAVFKSPVMAGKVCNELNAAFNSGFAEGRNHEQLQYIQTD